MKMLLNWNLSLSPCRKWAVVFSRIKSSWPTPSSVWMKIRFSRQMRWVGSLDADWGTTDYSCRSSVSVPASSNVAAEERFKFRVCKTCQVSRKRTSFTRFIKYTLDMTGVDLGRLGLPQCISATPARTAPMAESVHFKVQICVYSRGSQERKLD